MADALAHAHAQRVVHRDLKPSNVLVDITRATATIIDFGVARIDDGQQTRTGMTMGTPAYMAPEQLVGMPASPASDTYALGVLLFEMFTAQRPHGGASLGELLRQVAEAPPLSLATLRPDLPADVAAAVQQLLARDPAKRPADLAALARHLDALAAALPQRSMKAAGATGRHWP
jgi:serine/threonine-protein kinase